ncbi:CD-NTase-associated endodeoxyribonuclease Cap4 [Bacillus paranthracis]|uniref:CD-NTase-associated endodeoxyribonuclease Cap4 n=1 Tax=Bacillus paranthracis TaxID=2026186 RepID=UPI0021CF1617|nr:SAVED domain-containing protein [Bacillus paranthracis]MCU5202350.1 SAVED domain-containing protein [Bacillus paranthracis]HDR7766558.1 SAVED domain-containing protein [Bacillus paranthracis]
MNEQKPSLLEPESTGGDIAGGGFDFQRNLILNKIPYWLSFDGFTSLIWESIGDIEAKFFVPGKGMTIEAIEAKNHNMTPAKFWGEIERFQTMDKGSPGTYRWFTLSCTGVSDSIKPLINGLRRLRDPYSFFDERSGVLQNSYEAYKQIVLGLEKDEETAGFLFQKVMIEDTWGSLNAQPEGMFFGSLSENLPDFDELSRKKISNVYSYLTELLVSRKNKPVSRKEIEETIIRAIGDDEFFSKPTILETKINNDEVSGKQLLFMWEPFFGGKERSFPSSGEWTSQLLTELEQTKQWIVDNRTNRNIRLQGSRRNSSAMAIGQTFSAVSGFNIEMEYRGDSWNTNQYPTLDTPEYPTQIDLRIGKGKKLVVIIAIMKETMADEVRTFLNKSSEQENSVLEIASSFPIVSAEQINIVVNAIKGEIKKVCAQINVEEIDLFYAGPSHLALFLGHCWNAMPCTQCYEWVKTGEYVKTVRLS